MPSIDDMMSFCEEMCNTDTIYSLDSNKRNGVYYKNSPPYYFDCSSFVNCAVVAGGWDTSAKYLPNHNAWNTSAMEGALTDLGFTEYNYSDLKTLNRGDILLIKASERSGSSYGHTEIVYTGGSKSEFWEVGTGSTRGGTDDVYAAKKSHSFTWKHVFRWNAEQSTKEPNLYVIAGMLGNMRVESNVNPAIWEGLTNDATWDTVVILNSGTLGGYGLIQWTNTAESEAAYKAGNVSWRLRNMKNWLDDNGYAANSGEGQTNYIFVEDSWSSSRLHNHAIYDFDTKDSFLYDETITDTDTATKVWGYGAEGNLSDSNISTRQGYAKSFYDYISEHKNDSSITAWVNSKNNWLSESEMNNNAVMFYRCFANIVGDGTEYSSTGGLNNGVDNGDGELNYFDLMAAALGKSGGNNSNLITIKDRR